MERCCEILFLKGLPFQDQEVYRLQLKKRIFREHEDEFREMDVRERHKSLETYFQEDEKEFLQILSSIS